MQVIAMIVQMFEIASEGGGVAGHVDDGGDIGAGEGFEQGGIGTLAGRIEERNIEAFATGQEAGDLSGGVTTDEAGV